MQMQNKRETVSNILIDDIGSKLVTVSGIETTQSGAKKSEMRRYSAVGEKCREKKGARREIIFCYETVNVAAIFPPIK